MIPTTELQRVLDGPTQGEQAVNDTSRVDFVTDIGVDPAEVLLRAREVLSSVQREKQTGWPNRGMARSLAEVVC
jgi:hypothetical protein